ncbi:hypothetical protein E4U45_000072, partial [Claviceps purpurea]
MTLFRAMELELTMADMMKSARVDIETARASSKTARACDATATRENERALKTLTM